MKKTLVFLFFLLLAAGGVGYYILPRAKPHLPAPRPNVSVSGEELRSKDLLKKINNKAYELKQFAQRKGFSRKYAFLIDMSLPSGKKRFFIYDLQKDSVLHAGLVAHGSCNEPFRRTPYFSNKPNTGCSSEGRYKVGHAYRGRFGKSYKLHGLDSTNSNAYKRVVVLHAYGCVPDEETIVPLCNSLGCPMVSYNFRDTLATYIDRSQKPILLWISGG